MPVEHNYEVELNWKHGREGMLVSDGLQDTISVATPPQFPNGVEGVWSPEHLFTAAVSSCLMTTFLSVAENFKLPFDAFKCMAKGKLEMVDGKYQMSEILLQPYLTIHSEEDREKAMKVLNKSEAACLISNSIKSKIVFEPIVTVSLN